MINVIKTINGVQSVLDAPEKGCWIHMMAPTIEEINQVSEFSGVSDDVLKVALDDEERAHIDFDEGATLIIVDIPYVTIEGSTTVYNTMPLGIIHTEECIITITLVESPLPLMFIDGKVKDFYTNKKTRFIFQLLYKKCCNVPEVSSKHRQIHKRLKQRDAKKL